MERNEEELIDAYLGGESEAFAVVVQQLGPGLLGYLHKMVRSKEEAEDLFQESFRRALAKLSSYDSDRSFKPWLYRIARNVAIDHIRRYQRRPEQESLDDQDNDVIAATDPSPVDVTDLRERKALVQQAVGTLPDRQRETLILAYFQGMTYAQVAETLGCSVGTVKTQMSRALRTLAKRLPEIPLGQLAGGRS